MVLTTGKVHDLQAAAAFHWLANWTYIFDRGYVSFDFLTLILEAGAHFVIRFKRKIKYEVVASFAVPEAPKGPDLTLLSDEHMTFPNWAGVILRLVSYRLPDRKIYWVLTDRFDLSALSVAQLYKERWSIETWWRWIKQMFKIKRPLGESENALQLQIVSAFVTDLLLKAFKHSSGFTTGLYDFVARCKDASLTPISEIPENSITLVGSKKHSQILQSFRPRFFAAGFVDLPAAVSFFDCRGDVRELPRSEVCPGTVVSRLSNRARYLSSKIDFTFSLGVKGVISGSSSLAFWLIAAIWSLCPACPQFRH